MAKVELAPEFSLLSGKLCKKEKSVIAYNKQTGRMHRYDYHERKDANSADQKQVRSKFTLKSRAAALFWNNNKPSQERPDGSEVYKSIMKAYAAQHKYGNPYSFVRSLVNDQNKVEFGGKQYQGSIESDVDGLGS